MATQTDRRVIIVDTVPGKGFNQLNRQMGRLNKTTLNMRDSLSRVNTSFAAIGGAFTGRALSNVIDTFTEAEQRMSIFLDSGERAADMVELLADAAARTYTNFDLVSTVMTRMLIMGQNLKATYGDFLKVSEGLAASFTLSGSTVMEATNAARQLVQGLGSGTLQGEELRAVLEQNALVAQRLADHFNVGVGELRDMAAEGKLASQEVFEALKAGADDWIKTMENFTPSMRQSMAMLGSVFGSYLNDVNKSIGLTKTFGSVVKSVASNIDKVMQAAGAIVTGVLIAGVLRFTKFIFMFAKANPLVFAISAAVTAWSYFETDMENTFKFLAVWIDIFKNYFIKSMLSIRDTLSNFGGPAGKILFGDVTGELDAVEKRLDFLYKRSADLADERAKPKPPSQDIGLPDWLKDFAGTGGSGVNADSKKAAAQAAKDWASLKDELDPINAAMANYYEQLTLINQQTQLGANLQAEYADRAKQSMLQAAGVLEIIDEIDPTAAFVRQIEMLEQMMDAFPQYSEMIKEKILNVHEEMDNAIEGTVDKQKGLIMEVSTFVSDQAGRMADAFVSFATEAEFTISDMVESMLKDLARLLIFQSITQPLASAAGAYVGGLGGGAPIQEGLPGRAMGGPVSPGVAYTVGERGRETFIPNMAGRIIPNGGGGTNVQVINNTSAEATTERTRQSDGSELIRVIVGEVAKDITRNGAVGKSIQSMYGSRVQGVTR